MTSEFAHLAMLARHAVDAVHGEAATLKPQDRAKGPHGAGAPSATRAEQPIVVAFFQDTEFAARRRAWPTIGQAGDRMLNRSPEIYGSTSFAGEIAIGDRILRDPDGSRKLFEVVSRDPDGIGNAILGLASIANG
ncbi:hypothetical protein SAMN04488498_104342 [Mesorhizobium albiziae]|uniref:Uncharacterized protein n=1 Tax=Neomesorhizobium albiziae TaxID=335020 RepID=A0A1I3YCK2_9HYPH|nr:hypothetical protein [Mesorhizobium albiziae]GLS29953.1 hypothetical protein GCM10007937_16610 [Mesorhizobium albiziae]SFK29473.1 hypothetical protein SAMN04488498_104342 [Mesorhizobium albiziae]